MTTEEIKADISLYGKDIYSFCCYLTKNKIEAEDLYQDVFLKALEKNDRRIYDEDHKKYLLGLAIKLWKSHWRKMLSFSTEHAHSKNNLVDFLPSETTDVQVAFILEENLLDKAYIQLMNGYQEKQPYLSLGD